MIRRFAPLALLALAGGCVSLLPEPTPPPRVFPLAVGDVEYFAGRTTPAVIAVSTPDAARPLAGSDIAWFEKGAFAAIDGAAWNGRAMDRLQSMLAETIERQKLAFGGVRSADGARADFEIRWEVQDFQVIEGNSAKFSARARLINARTRMIVASTLVEASEPLDSRSASRAATALQAAARRGCGQLAAWAAQQAAEFYVPPAAAPPRRSEQSGILEQPKLADQPKFSDQPKAASISK